LFFVISQFNCRFAKNAKLSNAYLLKGDFDRAIADFEAVLKIDPNNIKAKEILNLARQKKQ